MNPISIKDFISDSFVSERISVRLRNVLQDNFQFVEEVNRRSMLDCRNAGIRTWIEFQELMIDLQAIADRLGRKSQSSFETKATEKPEEILQTVPWDKTWEEFKKTETYSLTISRNIHREYLKFLRRNYIIKRKKAGSWNMY